MRYQFRLYGRKAGAIGAFSHFTATVEAPNYETAVLKLYEEYEHISVNGWSIADSDN